MSVARLRLSWIERLSSELIVYLLGRLVTQDIVCITDLLELLGCFLLVARRRVRVVLLS
jgi:hypothetical protein